MIPFSFLRLSAAEKISDLVDRIDDSVHQLGLISFSSISKFFSHLEIEMENDTVEEDDNDEVWKYKIFNWTGERYEIRGGVSNRFKALKLFRAK